MRSLSLSVIATVAALLPAVPLAGQESVATGRHASHDAAIRIFSLTGSLRITTWTRDSVSVRGRVDQSAGQLALSGGDAAVKIAVEPPAERAPNGTADLDIQVPAGARLWVKSSGAEVDITAGGGQIEVQNGSGRVRVAGEAESVNVETLDGNVELVVHSPTARVRTASGTIVARNVVRELDASSVSGPLLVGMEGPIARARLETVSSEIAFKGTLEPEGSLDAETHGGDVELRLPATLGAAFHLVSYGGGLVNEMVPASVVRKGPGKGEWTFQTGDGRATVEVRTFKGTVTLKVRGEPPVSKE
ncbi:MAG TPA: DUF4097 family beta strand repeat-containing protein [Gemmatimonadales bacterium]|nr:DUF4097 family beta strand repeat-containing protein [Gemmatimonadales bacterium]